MPVEFLTDEQASRYGRYQGDPTPEQLTQFFFLSDADLRLIAERRRLENELGFAVQLGTLRFLGPFLQNPLDTPLLVVAHLAQQLQIEAGQFTKYAVRSATRHSHRQRIIAALDYREFDRFQTFRLIRWIYAQLALSASRPSVLFDLATAHLIQQRIVLPGVTVLARLIARVRERFTARTFQGLSQRLGPAQKATLHALLVLPEKDWQTPLERLRTPPTRVSTAALFQAIHRITQIRDIGVGTVDLSDVPESRLTVLVRYALTVRVQLIERLGEDRRLATLLVFLQHLERSATDDVLEMFGQVMNGLALRGEARRKRERLRSLKDLDQAALLLRDAVAVLLDPDIQPEDVRALAFERLGEAPLRAATLTVHELASPDADPAPEVLSGAYATVRRFLRSLLVTVDFSGTAGARPLLDALAFLKRMDEAGGGKPRWDEAPRGFVPKPWERRVFPGKGEVDQQAYTLCALDRLRHALKRREVFVERSQHHGDPRAELLRGAAWEDVRDDVCRALNRPLEVRGELEALRLELDQAYHEVERNLSQNKALTLTVQSGQTRVKLTSPEALDEPPSLQQLRAQIAARLPVIDLAELLMEVHAFTGLADAFTHVADRPPRMSERPPNSGG